jgi:hypothetical protein
VSTQTCPRTHTHARCVGTNLRRKTESALVFETPHLLLDLAVDFGGRICYQPLRIAKWWIAARRSKRARAWIECRSECEIRIAFLQSLPQLLHACALRLEDIGRTLVQWPS